MAQDTELNSVPSPLHIGPFALLTPMARGGMGTVWSGVHRNNHSPVAIKVIHKELASDPRHLEAFRNEVRAMASLDHPNIITILDMGAISLELAQRSDGRLEEGCPFLVMEYAGQATLESNPVPLCWPDVKRILLSLLDALAHAHASDVIHLDIKPGNALLVEHPGPNPWIKLTDFGIAQAFDQLTLLEDAHDAGWKDITRETGGEDAILGTPAYMAPEQFTGEWRDFGPWTDLYALGCLAYELVAGHPPFRCATALDYARSHWQELPVPLVPLWPVPEGLDAWVHQLLEKDPEARFRRAADAAWHLLQLQEMPEETSRAADPLLPAPKSPLPASFTPLPSPLPSYPYAEDRNTLVLRQLTHTTLQRPVPRDDCKIGGSLDEEPHGQSGPQKTGALPTRPPIPLSWRTHMPDPSPLLTGVGLGLFGLRPIPLVGRELERDHIWNALHRVDEDARAHCVMFEGPAGTGKGRLIEWMAARAHELGAATVLKAVHSPGGGPAEGLEPMVSRALRCVGLDPQNRGQRIQRLLVAQGVTDPYEWGALTALITPPVSDLGVGAMVQTESAQVVLHSPLERYVVIQRLIERLAQERLVILWVENAQWGLDAVLFVKHMLRMQVLAPCRLLCLLTIQEEALDPHTEEHTFLTELKSHPKASSIRLGPLPPTEHEAMIRQLIGLSDALTLEVVQRSQGSPLFAIQLLRDWVQRGLLEVSPQGFVLKSGADAELPADLRMAWATRIRRSLEGSGTDGMPALELAAVLGQTVLLQEWHAACREAHLNPPKDLIDRLEAFQWVQRYEHMSNPLGEPARGWAFVHSMVRESLELEARDAMRWQHHNRMCAQALHSLYPLSAPGVAARLGRHYLEAGMLDTALEPLLTAAEQAKVRSEYLVGHGILKRREDAMSALRISSTDLRWGEGWLLRTSLLLLQGNLEPALRLARRVETWADENDAKSALAEAWKLLGALLEKQGEFDQAQHFNQQAFTLFQSLSHWGGMADAVRGMVSCAREQGDIERAPELLDRAHTLYKRIGDRTGQGDCLLAMGHDAWVRRNFSRARTLHERAQAIFERAGEQRGRAEALRAQALVAIDQSELHRARALLEGAKVIFERIGVQLGLANCVNDLADVARLQGDLEGAETGYRHAIALFGDANYGSAPLPRFNLGLLHLTRGTYEVAEEILEECRQRLEHTGERILSHSCHGALLPCVVARQAWPKVDEHLRHARLLLDKGIVDRDDAWPIHRAAEMSLKLGRQDLAFRIYRLARALYQLLEDQEMVTRIDGMLELLGP